MRDSKIMFTYLSLLLILIAVWWVFFTWIHTPPSLTHTDGSGSNTHQAQALPCIKNPEISYFMYHYIRDDDKRDTSITRWLSIPPKIFENQMKTVQRLATEEKIYLMRWDEFEQSMLKNCFTKSPVWIFTADDGWMDTYTELFQIVQSYQIPFFIGIITSKIGSPGFVWTGEILKMSDSWLIRISSHSMHHRDHSHLSMTDEQREACESKALLESLIQKPIRTYIYPSGRIWENSEKNLKTCWYILAWSTGYGESSSWQEQNRYKINRIRITRSTWSDFFYWLLSDKVPTWDTEKIPESTYQTGYQHPHHTDLKNKF